MTSFQPDEDLPPGAYRFTVEAKNQYGLWSDRATDNIILDSSDPSLPGVMFSRAGGVYERHVLIGINVTKYKVGEELWLHLSTDYSPYQKVKIDTSSASINASNWQWISLTSSATLKGFVSRNGYTGPAESQYYSIANGSIVEKVSDVLHSLEYIYFPGRPAGATSDYLDPGLVGVQVDALYQFGLVAGRRYQQVLYCSGMSSMLTYLLERIGIPAANRNIAPGHMVVQVYDSETESFFAVDPLAGLIFIRKDTWLPASIEHVMDQVKLYGPDNIAEMNIIPVFSYRHNERTVVPDTVKAFFAFFGENPSPEAIASRFFRDHYYPGTLD